ncbi:MAG: 16S rRNA (cytidine(1402)-2'-O)-methyltransferase [Betaproteobacteria bacterium]|nr:16S rRNA (cytidine(1402)-2'-O)-methyltransferase [Betaproteobacteria bacterium]
MPHSPILYLIAAPIGNLSDISPRAVAALKEADIIAAEDTRRARKLLGACGVVGKTLLSLRAHNENRAAELLIKKISETGVAAYLSDAGTPGVSDPGARLVRAARAAGIAVSPIPGASALTALLSAAGAAAAAVHFFGFAPRAKAERLRFFAELPAFSGNIILFESPHRIADSAAALCAVFGGGTRAVLAREMTKLHEQIIDASLEKIAAMLAAGEIPARGEFSLLVESAGKKDLLPGRELFAALIKELPPRKAAKIAAQFCGGDAAEYYRQHTEDN